MSYRNLNGQALVNAQIAVNRAVFIMNARNNRAHHPFSMLDDSSLTDAALLKHVDEAVAYLRKVQESLLLQVEMFE
jgi:hypothetical protein